MVIIKGFRFSNSWVVPILNSSFEAYNVMSIVLNKGVGSFSATEYLGTYTGPAFSTANVFPYANLAYNPQISRSLNLGISNGWQVCFGARYSISNPGYTAVIGKFKIEYIG